MDGWNIEIMFMFSIAGIIYYNTLSGKRGLRVFGIPERLFWVIVYAAFCVFVECLLNLGGHLVWEYPFWRLSPLGVLPIFLAAYFPLFLITMLVTGLSSYTRKVRAVGIIYGTAIVLNMLAFGILGWNY
jgi:hypothetical protein